MPALGQASCASRPSGNLLADGVHDRERGALPGAAIRV